MSMQEGKRVTQYTVEEARDFFERLRAYSAEYVRVGIPQIHRFWPSRNHYEDWRDDVGPIGNVLHHTAGTNYAGTIRYFTLEHSASSNWVVGKALDRRFDDLRAKLDLAKDLRAEVCQVVGPEHPSWHAGWVNRFLTGIECRNAGCLRPVPRGRPVHPTSNLTRDEFFACGDLDLEQVDLYTWPNGWTTRFTGGATRVRSVGGASFWESWSRGQVATVVTILRYLNSLFPGRLRPEYLLAHHETNGGKPDVVHGLDLRAIRRAVLYSREHVDDLAWLADLDDCEDGFRDLDDPQLLRDEAVRQGDRQEDDLTDFDPGAVVGAVDTLEEVRTSLLLLGYHVDEEEKVAESVRIYQRSRDLVVDGVAGPQTQKALDRDVRGWRLVGKG